MVSVGIRELKARTSEIVRRVREQQAAIDITCRGRVVARLVPVEAWEDGVPDDDARWRELDRLAAEIGARWPKGLSAVDALRADRDRLEL